MRAFVTGATGFLGTTLIEQLVAKGWDVIAFHRASSDLSELRRIPGLTFAVGDVTDRASLQRAMPEEVDVVFHTAGSVGFLRADDERAQYETNVVGTRNVVDTALERRARRFVYTSTVLTYDYRSGRVTEQSAPNTSARYAYVHSKHLADLEVERGVSRGLDAVFLHPSAIFGAHDKATWSKMFRELQRGLPLPLAPPGAMSVCHMAKVADAHVKAVTRGGRGQHYLLGGVDATTLEVATEIARLLNKPGPRAVAPAAVFRLFGRAEYAVSTALGREPMVTPPMADILCETVLCDSARAVEELGYEPSSLRTMLSECHRWMVETGLLPEPAAAVAEPLPQA